MSNIPTFVKEFDSTINTVKKIAVSGSGRVNYLLQSADKKYVLTENNDVEENESFFYLSQILKNLNGLVPEILAINEARTAYIQTFVGEDTLLQKRLAGEDVEQFYKTAIQQLARLQIATAVVIDKSKLFDSKNFNAPLVYRDLFYFKNYFLDFTDLSYRQASLLKDFELIVKQTEHANYVHFMFRDYQGRNIMILDDKPYFIDYQDGMIGPIAYDLVSLLWQAKANLSALEKENFFNIYTQELEKLLPNQFNLEKFKQDYNNCLLLRLLQVLGAYGKLGIIQNKPHFKESISFGIQNLKTIKDASFMQKFPTLKNIFNKLSINSISKIDL